MSTPDLGLPTGKTPNDPFLTQAEVDATTAAIMDLFAGYLVKDVNGNSNVTLDEDDEARNSILKLTGTLTGSINLVLPTWDGKRWLIVNATTGSFSITCKTAAGAGIVVTQGYGAVLYCDGTDILRETVDQAAGTLRITSPRIVTSVLDTNGNEVFKITATASAVNEVTFTSAATGAGPTLAATGDDTNIPLNLSAKGTGAIQVNAPIKGNAVAQSNGRATKALSDANYTVLNTEYNSRILEFTGTLGAGRDIILPNTDGATFIVFNNTTGGFALTFKVTGQTGVAVAAGKRATIYCNGTDYVRATADV